MPYIRANRRQWANLDQAMCVAVEPDKFTEGRWAIFVDFPSGKRIVAGSYASETEAIDEAIDLVLIDSADDLDDDEVGR